MIIIASFGKPIQGYGACTEVLRAFLLLVPLLTVSLSLVLIADIDSPRGDLLRVAQQNLMSLEAPLRR